jgi:hypothetical protein
VAVEWQVRIQFRYTISAGTVWGMNGHAFRTLLQGSHRPRRPACVTHAMA